MANFVFALLILFAAGYEISGFFTGLVSSRFVKVFVGRDLRGFRYVAWTGVLTVLATAVLKAVQLFLANFLGILWRRNLVRTAHRLYFRNVSFFRVNDSSLDNPDQRLTQDIKRLCTATGDIVIPVIIAPFKIGWYSYQAYSTSDWYGPVGVYGFFLVSSIL